MKRIQLLISALILVSMFSCDETESQFIGEYKEVVIDATSNTNTIYFSFDEDSIVTVANPKTSLDWDLALYRYNFITNSGKSGSGNGGAVCAYTTSLEAVMEAPENGYITDDSLQMTLGFNQTTHMPILGKITGNFALTGPMPDPFTPKTDTTSHVWTQTYVGPATTFVPTLKVFVIKTAVGNYAKIQVLDYYRESVSGYVKIRYYYQADGSSAFGK